MKRNSKMIGLGIFSIGFVIVISGFLPIAALVYLQAILLMAIGIFYFCF